MGEARVHYAARRLVGNKAAGFTVIGSSSALCGFAPARTTGHPALVTCKRCQKYVAAQRVFRTQAGKTLTFDSVLSQS